MRFATSRLGRALCGLLLLTALQAKANTTYVADFSTSTLDPNLQVHILKNGSWSPDVVLPWIVSTGDGYLALAKTFTLPGSIYPDGPHVQTNVGIAGDFIATVTADSSYNGAGGAGFFLDTPTGYTGISFGTNWLGDSAGDGFSSTGYSAVATPLITLQITRIGNTLTKAYKLDGQSGFTVISSLTDDSTTGWAWFDLTNYSDQTAATAVLFTSFTVEQLAPVPEPQTWAMLAGGLVLLGALQRRQRRQRGA
ncbi:PEP-CTERM sorting domain-containing protein [Duganella guangzhouensis]|nr:PEP-CTERM sorting domain-containing protein [Duganella guangzhouensis]